MLNFALLFAAASAGLLGGIHCLGMCGGVSTLLSAQVADSVVDSVTKRAVLIPIHPQITSTPSHQLRNQIALHAGRLTTYMIIGAFFGAAGGSLRWWFLAGRFTLFSQVWHVVGSLLLCGLSLRILGQSMGLPKFLPSLLVRFLSTFYSDLYGKVSGIAGKFRQAPFLVGGVWGALPCGLSFAVAPFAMLSGSFWSGAVLMLVFGLCALPHLVLGQFMLQRSPSGFQTKVGVWISYGSALLMLAMGLMGLFYFDATSAPAWLCLTPR